MCGYAKRGNIKKNIKEVTVGSTLIIKGGHLLGLETAAYNRNVNNNGLNKKEVY